MVDQEIKLQKQMKLELKRRMTIMKQNMIASKDIKIMPPNATDPVTAKSEMSKTGTDTIVIDLEGGAGGDGDATGVVNKYQTEEDKELLRKKRDLGYYAKLGQNDQNPNGFVEKFQLPKIIQTDLQDEAGAYKGRLLQFQKD